MLCQICKKREATVYFTQIINGQKTNMWVCKQCAANHGIKIGLNSLLTGLLGIDREIQASNNIATRCDRCGMTADDFNRTGRMGCSRCYEVFYEPMQALLTRIHGNTRHLGKTPRKTEQPQTEDTQVEQLKQELQECIKTENYERAAQIRDRIKALNNVNGGRQG